MYPQKSTIAFLIVGGLVWVGGFALAPLLVQQEGVAGSIGSAIYQFFHQICHQQPDRSLHVFGLPMAVCARCASVYYSFVVGMIFVLIFFRRVEQIGFPRWLLIASVVPMLADVLAEWVGLYARTDASRMFTGGLFGFVVALYVVPALLDALRHRGRSTVPQASIHHQKGIDNVNV